MGCDIIIRSTGKLIFHNKIQQSSINITRLCTSGGRSNRSANKIIVVGIWEITQTWCSLESWWLRNKIELKNRSDENGERKTGRKNWQFLWSGGEENERQMKNNVNCEEMRFVIRNLVYVEDPPRQRRKTFLLMSLEAMSVFSQRGMDDAAQWR